MRSLLIINQAFFPDSDAISQMITDLAEDLVSKGINVQVVTGKNKNNYSADEIYNGVVVRRVKVLRLNKKFIFFRYLNYLSLFPSLIFNVFFMPRPDAVLVVSSPPFMYFVGWFVKILKRTKLIINIQDLYPDVAIKLKLISNPLLIRFLEILTQNVFLQAEKILCIGSQMKAKLLNKGIDPDKVEVIENWADSRMLWPLLKSESTFFSKSELNNKFVLQYSGNLGMVHEIDTILETAKLVKSDNIRFVFIGDGVQARKVKECGLKNVLLFPSQMRKDLNNSLNACDVAFVTLKMGFQGLVIPSKIYGIMAVGKPILGICSKDSEIANIIYDNNCGITIEPGKIKECVDVIDDFFTNRDQLKQFGENGRNAFLSKYDRVKQTNRYYKNIAPMLS